MKKILAAFDGLKYSESTERYATGLACREDRILTGVFLEDFTYHSYKLFDMVGSQGVSAEKVRGLMEQDARLRQASVRQFSGACVRSNVRNLIHQDKSIAIQELLRETIYADMLIIGNHETLSHNEEPLPSRFIRDLLIDVQCPVMAVPREYQEIERVILLYDGDPSAVYAAKMFSYLLPELELLPVEVITVQPNVQGSPWPDARLVQEFIECHFPKATFTVREGNPEKEILDLLDDRHHSLIVLGAYRRSTVSRWFKPSMADFLMKNVPMPLFIAHYR